MLEISITNPIQIYSKDQNEEFSNLKNKMGVLYATHTRRGFINRMIRLLTGKPVHMIDLNSYLQGTQILDSHYLGIRSVEIGRIQGSEGRSNDFDRTFHPTQEHTRHRWLSVASARMSGKVLPPIELIQVGEMYFVRDGHHRISVAQAFGEKFMDAFVTKFDVKPYV
jgi:hypothetical protein